MFGCCTFVLAIASLLTTAQTQTARVPDANNKMEEYALPGVELTKNESSNSPMISIVDDDESVARVSRAFSDRSDIGLRSSRRGGVLAFRSS
jgi:hypothetical protein